MAALVAFAIGSSAAAAQSASAPFAGKQIRMVIAAGAGGGYDTYARYLARQLGRHIAGSPTIISQNMPGAAGMAATNWAYAVAPKDGSVVLATYNSLLAEPLYGNSTARFDPRKFESVGSISKQQNICATWHTSPIKTIAQARTRELTVAATGATSDSATLPKILNAVAGTRFKVIAGYGTTEQRLAVERGEVDGVCGLSWSTMKAARPHWIKDNKLNVIVQLGLAKLPELPNVPAALDLVTDPVKKQVLALILMRQEIGRPVAAPPGVPADRLEILRRAFDETMKDPAFLAEAEKLQLEIEPLSARAIDALLANAFATPRTIVQQAAELIEPSGQK